jgi:hypothetical protein
VWQSAAESLSRFPDVVVTGISAEGYPVSVRQRSTRYDADGGEMPISMPASIAVVPGAANVLAHHHDEELANLQMVQIRGRLESREDDWVFVSTAFRPPTRGRLRSLWTMAKAMRRSSLRYLRARGMQRPQVNWAVIKTLQRQARRDRRRAQSGARTLASS